MYLEMSNVDSASIEFVLTILPLIAQNLNILLFCFQQVSLWKETLEGKWTCISDVNKGQGQVKDSQDQAS